MTTDEKIQKIREAMRADGIDAWLIITGDPHGGAYIEPHWAARAWVSGFTGTAGTVVITEDTAGLWVDSRYHMRGESETAGSSFQVFKLGQPGVKGHEEWLAETLGPEATLAFDERVVSVQAASRLKELLEPRGVLIRGHRDLLDGLWQDRPALNDEPLSVYPERFAGESAASKLGRVRSRMSAAAATHLLVTALDDIAWCLNIRGADVPNNPVGTAFLLVTTTGATLFSRPGKLTGEALAALDGLVEHADYGAAAEHLRKLPADTRVLADPATTNHALFSSLSHTAVMLQPSLITALKAVKNETELQGARNAHVKDGVALVRWLNWLSTVDLTGETEITAGEKLNHFRSLGADFQSVSFPTIAGHLANSAVGHYKSNPDHYLSAEGILLVDSGGQYLDGTTDITRTVALGEPTERQKLVYTTVLKSLIMLSRLTFPAGTTGRQLNAIARYHLWMQGWECRHGIGHGVGHYLHVHEGPQRINASNDVVFEPGMVNSNEPGVYFEGDFGVRLENMIVTESRGKGTFGDLLGFETLTVVPFDRKLIDVSLLTDEEIGWLDDYHSAVFAALEPHLSQAETAWLEPQTKPLQR